METYQKRIEIRWSDLDPNYHLRHSVYYDYGAYCRVSFLNENGITTASMLEHNIGPILFREECLFKREIKLGDEVTIDLKLDKAFSDLSRWTMIHEIYKTGNNGNKLSAIITVDGAWIDTTHRKLAKPPEIYKRAFDQIPRTDRFEYAERR